VRFLDTGQIPDVVEHERARKVEGALEHDLRHLAPGGAEPPLAH
jgi:hypothetical protein